ncbi:MAG: hypothetical protein ACOX2G_12325 [Bacillota bacterium]
MYTLDLQALMAERDMSNAEAREWVRRRLKAGHFWSRLNPDLLSGAELLPYLDADRPPRSPAALLPFPVPTPRYRELEPHASDYLEQLAGEKIRWCGRENAAGTALRRRVLAQLAYYYPDPTPAGEKYCWFMPNPQRSPFAPLIQMIFPALDRYRLEEPVLPAPPRDLPGEAWRSDRDDYGTSLRFSAFQESEGNIVLAVALQGAKTYWLGNYRLNPDRYAFIRQQFFFLLGERMEPWQSGALPHGSPFRGRVYRKPKKK